MVVAQSDLLNRSSRAERRLLAEAERTGLLLAEGSVEAGRTGLLLAEKLVGNSGAVWLLLLRLWLLHNWIV